VRLGSVLGFPLRLDVSWALLFLLLLWSFRVVVFPATVPGLDSAAYLGMALAATLGFCAALLAHELAHAVVARRAGVTVEGITLFLLGGMARTRAELPDPGTELRIASAGPLLSLALGGALAGLALAATLAGLPPAPTAVVQQLAWLNLGLAAFNLLPGFPLDGGRVLRAVLWGMTGDIRGATRTASGVGRAIGYALITLGGFMAVAGNVMGGVWSVCLGWYLRQAALSALEQHMLRTGPARAVPPRGPDGSAGR
jgi:Zn-dependent protease